MRASPAPTASAAASTSRSARWSPSATPPSITTRPSAAPEVQGPRAATASAAASTSAPATSLSVPRTTVLLTLIDCTINGNQAIGGAGGSGVMAATVWAAASRSWTGSSASLSASTVNGNQADGGKKGARQRRAGRGRRRLQPGDVRHRRVQRGQGEPRLHQQQRHLRIRRVSKLRGTALPSRPQPRDSSGEPSYAEDGMDSLFRRPFVKGDCPCGSFLC